MLRDTELYDLWNSTGKDTYGQFNEHVKVGTIDVRVTELTHSTDNTNPKFASSTHLGLTSDDSLVKGDIIKLDELEYAVEYIISDTRLIQVFLKQV